MCIHISRTATVPAIWALWQTQWYGWDFAVSTAAMLLLLFDDVNSTYTAYTASWYHEIPETAADNSAASDLDHSYTCCDT